MPNFKLSFTMKKYLFLFMAMLMSVSALTLASCSSDSGATFSVTFTDGDNYYTYWQFQSRENIKAGQKLAVSAIFFGDDSVRSTDECSENATVKSINSDKITIEFKDFSFERYTSISSINKQKITINGTITFTLDE